MLSDFLTDERETIIARCTSKVALRRLPRATDEALDHGVPEFLAQLVGALRHESPRGSDIAETATRHGHEMFRRGVSVDQIVHAYGDVCQSVTDLAVESNVPISTDEFRTMNRCLDEAIADAVLEYGRQHDLVVSDGQMERLGVLAHELRNLINAASLSFEALSSGNVGIGGNTAAVLRRSLLGMAVLVDRSISEVRLNTGLLSRSRIAFAEFIEEVRVSALLEGRARNIGLVVPTVGEGIFVMADRQTLAAVFANLLLNGYKFTRPGGTVTLRVVCEADRVLVEVADECGGLPTGKAEELFEPFTQRGADRTGLGLGLTICLRAVEANGGMLRVRNLPGTGCVFTVDLPRAPELENWPN